MKRIRYYYDDAKVIGVNKQSELRIIDELYHKAIDKAVSEGYLPIHEDVFSGEFELDGRRIGIKLSCIYVGKCIAKNWLGCSKIRHCLRYDNLIL